MRESRSVFPGGNRSIENRSIELRRVLQGIGKVVGLEVLRRDESFVFFKVAEGYGGHAQNLALFDATLVFDERSPQLNPAETTLHHIALNVALEDFESEKMRLGGLGLKVNATVHEWLHVRSLYFADPEGNLLEFVCYDETVR